MTQSSLLEIMVCATPDSPTANLTRQLIFSLMNINETVKNFR
jgi:hypothetical protein